MQASQLIKLLNQLIKNYGDCEVQLQPKDHQDDNLENLEQIKITRDLLGESIFILRAEPYLGRIYTEADIIPEDQIPVKEPLASAFFGKECTIKPADIEKAEGLPPVGDNNGDWVFKVGDRVRVVKDYPMDNSDQIGTSRVGQTGIINYISKLFRIEFDIDGICHSYPPHYLASLSTPTHEEIEASVKAEINGIYPPPISREPKYQLQDVIKIISYTCQLNKGDYALIIDIKDYYSTYKYKVKHNKLDGSSFIEWVNEQAIEKAAELYDEGGNIEFVDKSPKLGGITLML